MGHPPDPRFAAEIGRILEAAGHTVVLQQWYFAHRSFMVSGCERELAELSSVLLDDSAIAIVQGLGGVGESSVAREYAWRRMHEAQACLEEAEPLFARALAIRENAFDRDHRLTQEVREALHKLRSQC